MGKKKRSFKLYILLSFVFAVVGILGMNQRADAKEDKIRVGLFSLGNFQKFDENGDPWGYNVDYLKRIAEHTGWDYEFVPAENWVDATGMLERGEIDLLAPAQNIPSLSEKFAYASYPMGTECAAIYGLASRNDLIYEDFEKFSGLHYGAVEDSTFTREFMGNYTKRVGFEPDITYYNNTTELFDALKSEKVDAIVTNIMFFDDNIKLLDRFSPLPVYYISSKDKKELLEELYQAMCAIELSTSSFATELTNRYFPHYADTEFSQAEYEYRKEAPEIVIGYVGGNSPLCYRDRETGEMAGIVRDILDRVEKISGLVFRYEEIDAHQIDREYLRKKQIYVIANVCFTTENIAVNNMRMSDPYLDTDMILVGEKENIPDVQEKLKIAVSPTIMKMNSYIKEFNENYNLVSYDSVGECFEAVRSGKADALLQNRYVAERYLIKPVYESMEIIPAQSIPQALCLGTVSFEESEAKDMEFLNDERFLSIINKSIGHITADELDTIVITDTSSAKYSLNFMDFAYKYRYHMIMLAVFIAVVIGILARTNRIEERKNRELEQKNNQLAVAINQANEASGAKSKFLSHMSHEIRTPMNSIVGMTRLAKRVKGNPAKTMQYLQKIDTSSKMLLDIINDVLDMSSIENNKLRIANSPFDFKRLLSSVSELYYSQCRQKGVHFEMLISSPCEEMLVGDALRVNQVLNNLLSNAYKFTESGGSIKVAVSEHNITKENRVYIRFVVEDTGCGMSEEMVERIFYAFEQEDATTALYHGGSGLGMSITKNLVDLMHGAIQVTSKKGKGTKFTVDLPFQVPENIGSPDGNQLKQIRALIVDNEEDMGQYAASVLENMGIRYDYVSSGEKALEIIAKAESEGDPYNACFLDWRMPQMNGLDTAKKIREQFDKDMLVIIVSAYDLEEIEDEAVEAGVDHLITKPLFQSTVYNVLLSLCGRGNGEGRTERDYDFTGKKALIAEDFELNRELITDLLEIVHLDSECVNDGKQAVTAFLNAPAGTYDVILMDIQMPNMDGYQATEAIRSSAHPDAEAIPIFAMTANAFTEDVSAALSSGMNGHIAKPIDADALYQILYKTLLGRNNV